MPKFDQKAKMREVAEKIQRQKELDAKKDLEFYEKITSGPLWTFYKVMMVFCLVLLVLTTIDTYVDGPTRKVGSEYKFDRSLGA